MVRVESPDSLIQRQLQVELDKRLQRDLETLMQDSTFRRVVSYLFMMCGMRDCYPQGNSKDFYNLGRRSVGVQLSHAIDSIGKPHRMAGLELRQQAEREYAELELTLYDHIKKMMDKPSHNNMEQGNMRRNIPWQKKQR